MDNPRELILCGVRCFPGAQRGLLRPITLLVGENSTGKTTFLGCYSILHQVFSRPDVDRFLDFNEQPFAMGAFRDIARTKRGSGGRIDEFKIGLAVDPASDSAMPPYTLFVTFREEGSQPVISSFRFQFEGDSFLELRRSADGTVWSIPGHDEEMRVPFGLVVYMLDSLRSMTVDDKPERAQRDRRQASAPAELPGMQPVARYIRSLSTRCEEVEHEPDGAMQERAGFAPPRLPELIPVAPLRSRPERSYNPIRETASPEGEHVPMLMMRLNRTDRAADPGGRDDRRRIPPRNRASWVQAGRASVVPACRFADDERRLGVLGSLRSDDPHVRALARKTGVRLLYTNDLDLIADFKNKKLIDHPRGRVYSSVANAGPLDKAVCGRVMD